MDNSQEVGLRLKKQWFRPAAFGSVSVLILLSFLMLFPFASETTNAEVIETGDGGTITLTASDIGMATIAPSHDGAVFSTSSINVSVKTTSTVGYMLSIRSKTNDPTTNSKLISDSGEYLESLASPVARTTFADSSDYDGLWGYRPDYIEASQNTEDMFYPAPTYAGTMLTTTDSANSIANNYELEIGARINFENDPGVYSNIFQIVAVSNIDPSDRLITMDDCNPSADNISNAVCMQDVNEGVIRSMSIGQQYQLADGRDGKMYYLARMVNGSVWMTQNLDLDLSSSTTYTHADTDLGWTNYNTSATWTPTNSTIDATSGTISGWTNSNTSPYSVDMGDIYYYTSGGSSSDTVFSSLADCMSFGNSRAECMHYKNGNYYNWTAAVASNDTSSLTSGDMVAEDSICPAGWRLPEGNYSATGLNYSEFSKLLYSQGLLSSLTYAGGNNDTIYKSTGYIGIRDDALYFVRGGGINSSGVLSYAASFGNYISSGLASSGYYNSLYFGGLYLYPKNNGGRGDGHSVRCVSRYGAEGTMQTVGKWGSQLKENDSIRAIDTRDNKLYWVTRLKDGSIWMTQNLDLNLTHVDSGEIKLNSKNTDLNVYNTGIYTDGYTKVDNVIYYNPTRSTSSISSWVSNATSPYSADDGDKYYYTSGTTSDDTVYNSLAECKQDHSEGECLHYHNGNYYNWVAAVASNDSSNYTTTTVGKVAENSICPAGWRLPLGPTSDANYSAYAGSGYSEFSKLLYSYEIIPSLTSSSGDSAASITIRNAPFYFTRSGFASDGFDSSAYVFNPARIGSYWSSVFNSRAFSRGFGLTRNSVGLINNVGSTSGSSVRCVARESEPEMQNVQYWDDILIPNENDSIQAIDNRDNKKYWVTRMKDGSIWMTQNLDLDLSSSTTYTHADTDLGWTNYNTSVTWTPTNSTIDATSGTISGWADSNTLPYSVDMGDKYYYTSGTTSNDTTYNSLANCKQDHTEDECLHYHNGNYYNWTAAIASNDSSSYSSTYEMAENSICPAGWRLPFSFVRDGYPPTTASEFNKLLYNQGVVTVANAGTWQADYAINGFNNVRTDPLYIVRAGTIGNLTIRDSGETGRYWSNMVSDRTSNRSNDSDFYSTNTNPGSASDRSRGSSVRCVVRSD